MPRAVRVVRELACDVRLRWACADADYGKGTLVPVRYDGRPAVLVVGAAPGDELPVKVLACGTAEVLRSGSVPAR